VAFSAFVTELRLNLGSARREIATGTPSKQRRQQEGKSSLLHMICEIHHEWLENSSELSRRADVALLDPHVPTGDSGCRFGLEGVFVYGMRFGKGI